MQNKAAALAAGVHELNSVRVNWQLKALLPVVFVLLVGLLLFIVATVSFRDPERHAVLIVAGAGAVAICAVSIGALAYVIQRPMVELQEKIALVSEGNLNVAVGFAKRNDEIGDLGRNFNHMMQQLRESREEIERLHRTQMSRAEHLATLSTSPARAVVKDVRQEVAQINRILTDLLETARPHPPQICRSNINTTVEHAVMLARQQVISRPIKIVLQQAPDLPEVEHDSDQIHQVLLNLLLNAVQAIDGGGAGTVRVRVGSREGCASVLVSDSGRGISPQNLPNIFRPFFTTRDKGTGLGLAVVQQIVLAHGWEIQYIPKEPKGAIFRLSRLKLPSKAG